MLGYICLGAGGLAVVLGLVINAQASRRTNVVKHRDDRLLPDTVNVSHKEGEWGCGGHSEEGLQTGRRHGY